MDHLPASDANRIDPADLARLYSAAATLAATVLFTALLISFEPFAAFSRISDAPQGPNPLNQIGFTLLGLVSLLGMFMLADRRRIAAIADIAWVPVIICLLLSASIGADPASATRSVFFTLVVIIICAGVLAIPHSVAGFRQAVTWSLMIVLALCYFGVAVFPDLAVHSAGGNEAQHEGLWHGLFPHKNVAGPVMAAFIFFGFYLMRSGQRWSGVAVALLAAIFVIQTGSKTTNGLVPVAIGVVIAGRLFASRWLPPLLMAISVSIMAALTVGTVVSPPLADIVAGLLSDPTYTGRDELWTIALKNIAARPWTGYGFDNFWLKPIVTNAFLPIDADWDYRGIVNGHNNYLDLALFMGWPMAAIVIAILCLRPLAHYIRCRPGAENRRLADLFLMILTFVLLNSFLESSWFRRADPTWVMMIIAVLGLHMTARLQMQSKNGFQAPAS